MNKKDKQIYPDPEGGEPWSGITVEELEKAGFEVDERDEWRHSKLPKELYLNLIDDEWWFSWDATLPEDEYDNCRDVRQVKYMYQIDNMFHGFTDRWLGLI